MLHLIRGYSIFFTGLLYIGCSLTGAGDWHGVLTAATVLIILQCLPVTTGITRFVSYGLFFLGTALLLSCGAGGSTWLRAVTQNGQVFTLIVFVPLMGIPLRFPRYRSALESALKKTITGSRDGLYVLGQGLSHLLGSVVNIACLGITYHILTVATGGRYKRLLAKAAMRGYAATVLWSPNSAAVAVVLAYWDHQLVDIIPCGLPLVMFTLLVGWLENRFGYLYHLKRQFPACSETPAGDAAEAYCSPPPGAAARGKDVRQLLLGITSMLLVVIVTDVLSSISILTLVPLVALVFPFVWAVFTGNMVNYKQAFKEHLAGALPKMANEAAIFLGAGFFAVAVGTSPVGDNLPLLFKSVAGSASLVVLLTGALIIGLSIIGFHPMLTTTSILAALTPETLGLSFPFMAMAILGSFCIALTCSPFSAGNLNVAALVGLESTEVSLKWQLVYSLLMLLVLIGYLNILSFIWI